MSDIEMIEVVVAPGHSMRDPGPVTTARIHIGNGVFEERVVDAPQRAVMPGEKILVRADAVAQLIKLGAILDPASGTASPEFAPVPAERSA